MATVCLRELVGRSTMASFGMQSQKLGYSVCTYQKDSFSMGGTVRNVLEEFHPALSTFAVIDSKVNMQKAIAIVHHNLPTPTRKNELWKKLMNPEYVKKAFTDEGVRKVFNICAPLLKPKHLDQWSIQIRGHMDNIQQGEPSILLLNASGIKGYFKSTGIPLALHCLQFGFIPQDGQHLNLDLQTALRNHISPESEAQLAELFSDCKDVEHVRNFIYVSQQRACECCVINIQRGKMILCYLYLDKSPRKQHRLPAEWR